MFTEIKHSIWQISHNRGRKLELPPNHTICGWKSDMTAKQSGTRSKGRRIKAKSVRVPTFTECCLPHEFFSAVVLKLNDFIGSSFNPTGFWWHQVLVKPPPTQGAWLNYLNGVFVDKFHFHPVRAWVRGDSVLFDKHGPIYLVLWMDLADWYVPLWLHNIYSRESPE